MSAGPSSHCGTLASPFAHSFSQRKAYFTAYFVRHSPATPVLKSPIVHPASPFVHRLDLSPFCRSPRGRGCEDVHARYRVARERTSPSVVCCFRAPSSANRYKKKLTKTRENLDAPSIAKDYWRLEENATIKDVLYAVRSDETTHPFVNHSLQFANSCPVHCQLWFKEGPRAGMFQGKMTSPPCTAGPPTRKEEATPNLGSPPAWEALDGGAASRTVSFQISDAT
jgi:hypothetical protein